MIQNYIENANFEDTGFAYTLSLISGKHKIAYGGGQRPLVRSRTAAVRSE